LIYRDLFMPRGRPGLAATVPPAVPPFNSASIVV